MPWFKFRRSWFVFFKRISKDDVIVLLECIEAFLAETELPKVPERLEYIWLMMQLDLEGDVKRLKKAAETRRFAGRKGGSPRKTVQEDPAAENNLPVSENKNNCVRMKEGDTEKDINNKETDKDKETDSEEDQDTLEEDKDTVENKKLEREKETVDIPPLSPPEGGKGLFDQFWSVYPRKACKAAARKAFDKLNVTDEKLAELLDELARLKRSGLWTRGNGQDIPFASTWLNGKRRKDTGAEARRPGDDFLEMLYPGRERHA